MSGSILLNNNETSFSKLAKASDAHDSLSKVQKKKNEQKVKQKSPHLSIRACVA